MLLEDLGFLLPQVRNSVSCAPTIAMTDERQQFLCNRIVYTMAHRSEIRLSLKLYINYHYEMNNTDTVDCRQAFCQTTKSFMKAASIQIFQFILEESQTTKYFLLIHWYCVQEAHILTID